MQMRTPTKTLSRDLLLDPAAMHTPFSKPNDDPLFLMFEASQSQCSTGCPPLSRASSVDSVATIEMSVEGDTSAVPVTSSFTKLALNSSYRPRRALQRCRTPVTPYPSSSTRHLLNAPKAKRSYRLQHVYDHDWLSSEEEEAEFFALPVTPTPRSSLGSDAHNRFERSLSRALYSPSPSSPTPKRHLSSTRRAVDSIQQQRCAESAACDPAAMGRVAKEMLTMFFSDEELGKMLSTSNAQGFLELMERCKVAKDKADVHRQQLFNAAVSPSPSPSSVPLPRKRPLRREPTLFLNSDGQWVDPRPQGHDPNEPLFGSCTLKSPIKLPDNCDESSDVVTLKARNLMGDALLPAV